MSALSAAIALAGDVLARENLALTAMNLKQAAVLLPEKTAVLAALETLAEQGPVAAGADTVAAAKRLDALAEENRVLLRRAITAQERVIGIVVGAAASVAGPISYRASGHPTRDLGPISLSTRA